MRNALPLFLLLLCAAAAFGAGLESELGIDRAGIRLGRTTGFHTSKEITAAATVLTTREVLPTDYICKGALFAAELKVFGVFATRGTAKARETVAAKAAIGKLGITSSSLQTILLQGASRLMGRVSAAGVPKSAAEFFRGAFLKRPTPGGLRTAAGQAIYLAAQDYEYAIEHGADPGHPDVQGAKAAIRRAATAYVGYTGLLDTLSLTYTVYSPEGYNQILADCTRAADLLKGLPQSPVQYSVVAN